MSASSSSGVMNCPSTLLLSDSRPTDRPNLK
eukprot:CAMPEP_0169275136 /NCGR_PEP_ID=MMETSP1016-20121227/52153_1 /TAXON_ID=342587 /ORGANISM="Karlodinium micrum, Strain CCMP2283" /LENGTH=30 /DNA_ID= /DNA_START= /DNA_END= /DNA_ORIENTATION=